MPIWQVEVHHERAEHTIDGFNGLVNLGSADPDPLPVEGRIRASKHEAPVAVVDPEEVAMSPNPREDVEVRRAVARAVLVAPEPHRHGGHRLGNDKLTHLVDDASAVIVESTDRDPE